MAAQPEGGIVRFSQEAWGELRKVTWPARETVIRLTIVVLLISALIAAYIYVFDNIFTQVVTIWILQTPQTSPPPGQ